MTHLYQPTTDEITSVTESMTVAYTGDKARIERAAQLLAAGAVDYISNGIGWSVASQRQTKRQDPEDPEPVAYHVTSTSCGCYDHLIRASAQGQCGSETVTVRPACKHIYAVQAYIRIIAAKLNEAMQAPFSGIFGIETRDANTFAVYDRLTNAAICGAVYSVKSDAYRPQNGQDAADFARWLYDQPQEFYPGGMLEQVLRTSPSDKLTLRATVYYEQPRRYVLDGYRYNDHNWVNLTYEQRQEFNEAAWSTNLETYGWVLATRPMKMTGLSYHYRLERANGDQTRFSLHSASDVLVERERQNRAFDAIAAADGGAA